MGQDLPGFKPFMVRFLVRMASDFSTRSVEITDESHGEGYCRSFQSSILLSFFLFFSIVNQLCKKLLLIFRLDNRPNISERCQWEKSPHPYIFFNEDNTLSFYGLHIGPNRDLIDERSGKILEDDIMSNELYASLIVQKVKFNQSFDEMTREQKLEDVCR